MGAAVIDSKCTLSLYCRERGEKDTESVKRAVDGCIGFT